MTCSNSTIWEARQQTVRRIEAQQRQKRREYERQLRRQEVPAERRQELLGELAADQNQRLQDVERGFAVVGVRIGGVP